MVVQLAIFPGGTQWTPSPYQVAEQLAALGLALNSTLETTNTVLGTPAQTDDIITTLPANLLAGGVPPYIPDLKSAYAYQLDPSDSPETLITFDADSRIWAVSLSFSVVTSSAYSGAAGPFAAIQTPSQTLVICQLALDAPSQSLSSDQGLAIGGIPVSSGEGITCDINNGTSVTDAVLRAAALILYTTP